VLTAWGRWNRAGQYGCLYLALTPEGALAERERYAARAALSGLSFGPHELVSIDLTIVDGALDLTDPFVLFVPSAPLDDATNVVIYQDVPPASCRLSAGPDRIPIA
jgi:RES domain-containing protein